jgi:sulfite reductase beta subunit-like hemoprotein
MNIQQDVCITTRQDIQIHYVSLDRTPQLWAQLAKMILHFVKLVETQFEILQQVKQQD